MSHYLNHPDFYNKPVCLSEDQILDPIQVLRDFFTDYNLSEVRDILSTNAEVCLTCDIHPYDAGEKRCDFLLFQKKLELLLEAAFLLRNQQPTDEEPL
jgi:hypothetical protein